MKKLLCILMMLLLAFPALAEENPFAPFTLTAPDGVTLEENESACTFVSGTTRVVAQLISRVPDEDPSQAIRRLMAQFEPDAVIQGELAAAKGYAGLTAVTKDKFAAGVNQWNVMLLGPAGDLLILSGYDLEGDNESVHALLDALLEGLTAEGMPIITND